MKTEYVLYIMDDVKQDCCVAFGPWDGLKTLKYG